MHKSITLLLLVCLAPAYSGTRKGAVLVEVGQPNVWSLEQAHYLLEKLRNKNGELEPAPLGKLDPNATNASKFDALRTLFTVQAEYDQSIGVSNSMLGGQYQQNLQMRQTLMTRWQALSAEQAQVSQQLLAARMQRAQMNSTPFTDADRKSKDDEIAALASNNADLINQVNSIQQTMGAVGVSPNFKATAPNLANNKDLPNSLDPDSIKSALKKAVQAEPRLAASAALDNHVQFNYEIIAKQLTLLRDEVGRDMRVLFLELPQTVYGVPGKGDGHVAQTWWSVAQVFRGSYEGASADGSAKSKHIPSLALQMAINYEKVPAPLDCSKQTPKAQQDACAAGNQTVAEYRTLVADSKREDIKVTNFSVLNLAGMRAGSAVPPVRAVELIPRANAQNVAETYSVIKQSAYSVVARWLFGLGAAANYQRQRETFDQFIHQEVYASGHGKGTSEFGWVFGPNPGMKSISPGVRTTYAVLAVPSDAVGLELKGRGCQFNRKNPPPVGYPSKYTESTVENGVECGREMSFYVDVPTVKEEYFSIDEIDYLPVKSGDRVTVFVRGDRIGPQLSVLVDGVPLTRVLNLGSPKTWRDPNVDTASAIKGEWEYLSSTNFALSFSMPPDYIGTPNISVLSPTKAYTLNRLSFKEISGCVQNSKKPKCAHWSANVMSLQEFSDNSNWVMFKPRLSISQVEADGYDPTAKPPTVTLSVLGRNFDASTVWRLNGKDVCRKPTGVTSTTASLDCDRPAAPTWQIAAIGHNSSAPETAALSIDDPFPPLLDKCDALDAKKEVPKSDKNPAATPATARIQCTGKFLNAGQKFDIKDADVSVVSISSTEAVIDVSKATANMILVVKGADKKFREQKPVVVDALKP